MHGRAPVIAPNAIDFPALFESTPSLYLILDPNFDIVAVNRAYRAATMTGPEIVGRNLFEVFPDNPDDPSADGVRNLRASLMRVLETGGTDTMAVQKYDIRRPESEGGGFEVRYWSPVNSPVLGPEGRVKYIIHRVEDVTEFVRLKEELRLRTLDNEAQRVESEHMATEIFRRSQQLGESNRQLRAANEGMVGIYNEVLAMVSRANAELHLRDDTPTPLAESSHVEPSEILKQVARLISGHRQLEAELRQSQKMEAVGRLAGGIAHDFNNILTIILGYCNLLLAKVAQEDPIRSKLIDIRDAGERAAELTNQLLVFSRHQVVEPRVISPVRALKDIDRMLRRVLGEDIEIVTVADASSGQIRIEPSQFQQILMNLVVNSRDAMPRGGKLTIELRNHLIEPGGAAPHFDTPPGDYVALAVTDNGTGMTPEVRQRVFEPFFTTKEAGRGTGLGLATVYGIVKQVGGHVWLYSEPGVGTTFRIFFPRVDEAADEEVATAPATVARGHETILLVEDDHRIRAMVTEILTDAGYTVLSAGNGNDAIAASQRALGEIHLLLTDVVLPGMSGKQVAGQIASQRPGIKVLYMSGYTGDAMAHHDVLNEPTLEFIQKPFLPHALCEKVRSVLNASELPPARVLVVDDIPAVLTLVATILEDAGFQVLTASGGHAARKQAADTRIDLVLTDLSMPEGEGIETIRALRKEHSGLKIIAMSGAFGPEVLRIAKALGADATLSKPLNPTTLVACVRRLLNPSPENNK